MTSNYTTAAHNIHTLMTMPLLSASINLIIPDGKKQYAQKKMRNTTHRRRWSSTFFMNESFLNRYPKYSFNKTDSLSIKNTSVFLNTQLFTLLS